MRRKNSPGCKCCVRSCSSIPFCIYDFPTTAYTGDSLGTNTMPLLFRNDGNAVWRSTTPSVFTVSQAWKFNPINGTCSADGTSVYVWYQFNLVCQGGGKFLASFAKLWHSACCDLTDDGIPGPFAHRYSSLATIPPAAFTGEIVLGLIQYPCGATTFDFNYPTERNDLGNCALEPNLAIPGGGGLLSVTF